MMSCGLSSRTLAIWRYGVGSHNKCADQASACLWRRPLRCDDGDGKQVVEDSVKSSSAL